MPTAHHAAKKLRCGCLLRKVADLGPTGALRGAEPIVQADAEDFVRELAAVDRHAAEARAAERPEIDVKELRVLSSPRCLRRGSMATSSASE
jgi:hypothetical protein